ncbi:hypothetical protein K501DRAFT_268708 [Backusella circina FSU 941]|nr:hypothetical protein K501DRAFT_268708 [Backusella circina FSU 941]
MDHIFEGITKTVNLLKDHNNTPIGFHIDWNVYHWRRLVTCIMSVKIIIVLPCIHARFKPVFWKSLIAEDPFGCSALMRRYFCGNHLPRSRPFLKRKVVRMGQTENEISLAEGASGCSYCCLLFRMLLNRHSSSIRYLVEILIRM